MMSSHLGRTSPYKNVKTHYFVYNMFIDVAAHLDNVNVVTNKRAYEITWQMNFAVFQFFQM